MTRLSHAPGHGSRWESSLCRRAGDSGGTIVCLDSTVSGLQSSTRRAGQRYRKLRSWEAEQRAWDHAAALQQLWTRLSCRALRPRSPHCPRKASSCPVAAAALTQHTQLTSRSPFYQKTGKPVPSPPQKTSSPAPGDSAHARNYPWLPAFPHSRHQHGWCAPPSERTLTHACAHPPRPVTLTFPQGL